MANFEIIPMNYSFDISDDFNFHETWPSTSVVLSIRPKHFSMADFEHWLSKIQEVNEWCKTNIGDNWDVVSNPEGLWIHDGEGPVFLFKTVNHALALKLACC